MKITILNGNPDEQNQEFDATLARLSQKLEENNSQVTTLVLRDLNLQYCTGCFGCWVKTPGECATRDDGPQVLRAIINSDFMLWAAPMRLGFPSALLKKTMDKSVPLIHPYFVVDHGEAHHRARYDHYPRLGLLLEKEAGGDAEDIRLVTDIFSRTALNMKSRLEFVMLTGQPVEEMAGAILNQLPAKEMFEMGLAPTHGEQVAPPTHLTVFNGSPRGAKGNTPIMLEQFIKGFNAIPGRSAEIHHLNHIKDAQEFARAYNQAQCALLGFPLYTDTMPGIVKAFIESIEPYSRQTGKPLGFLVQSGFPEAAHMRHVERYLQKLAARMGSPYLGTVVKGSGEAIRQMPEQMNRKLFDALFRLGKTFGETGAFDAEILHNIAGVERYPAYLMPVFKLLSGTPLLNFYWNGMLKENGVYDKRFARPFVE